MKGAFVLALLVAGLGGPLTAAELDWPTFHHDPQRTGRTVGSGIRNAGKRPRPEP